ncbi:MAG: hypothetical protein ACM31D_04375 [Bacteroidota bacterium]
MTSFKIAATFATLLLVAGCTAANAEDATTKATTPTTYGPGWRHEQMMQARAQGQGMPAMMYQRGPGMGYGMGRGGPPLNADGTVDTAKLPDWCPMKASLQQTR